jgi:hypothetical protein
MIWFALTVLTSVWLSMLLSVLFTGTVPVESPKDES